LYRYKLIIYIKIYGKAIVKQNQEENIEKIIKLMNSIKEKSWKIKKKSKLNSNCKLTLFIIELINDLKQKKNGK